MIEQIIFYLFFNIIDSKELCQALYIKIFGLVVPSGKNFYGRKLIITDSSSVTKLTSNNINILNHSFIEDPPRLLSILTIAAVDGKTSRVKAAKRVTRCVTSFSSRSLNVTSCTLWFTT